MRLLDRLRGHEPEQRQDGMLYQGSWYPLGMQTLTGSQENIPSDYVGLADQAYKASGPVFACLSLRMKVFSQARFAWQRRRQGRAQQMFTDQRLAPLETPWPGGTTQQLLQRLLLDRDLAGNAYATLNQLGELRILRPDWVTIVRGVSRNDPDDDPHGLNSTLLGYIYKPGGQWSNADPVTLMPGEVGHFAGDPDPIAAFRGISWLTPLIKEISGDASMSEHKRKFFNQGATPNMIIKYDPSINEETFQKAKRDFDAQYGGLENAYKALHIAGGMDATVVGKDLQELDFKVTQGHGETRIAAAAGVHPVVVGFSEGMQGSSLNAGNYESARRNTADTTFHPLWQDIAGSLQPIIQRGRAEPGIELAADVRGVSFLRSDEKNEAEVQQMRSSTMANLIREGFTPESVVLAVTTGDLTLLEHSGLVSVQLREPGAAGPNDGQANGNGRAAITIGAG